MEIYIKNRRKTCKNHEETIMPNNENNISKYHYEKKSIRHPFVIHVDFEVILEKMDSLNNLI